MDSILNYCKNNNLTKSCKLQINNKMINNK